MTHSLQILKFSKNDYLKFLLDKNQSLEFISKTLVDIIF